MYCRKVWRRPGVKLEIPSLDDTRLSAKEIRKCIKDYDVVIVWGKPQSMEEATIKEVDE